MNISKFIQTSEAKRFQKKVCTTLGLALIIVDSVMKMNKKIYPQVYLEECKYVVRKKKIISFIDAELELDDSGNSDSK